MRRCELAGADLDGLSREDKTLDLFDTRVVIDGKVVESDGKTAGLGTLSPWMPSRSACSSPTSG